MQTQPATPVTATAETATTTEPETFGIEFIDKWLAEKRHRIPDSGHQARDYLGYEVASVKYDANYGDGLYTDENIWVTNEADAKARWEHLRMLGKGLNEIAACLTNSCRLASISDVTIRKKKLPLSVLILEVERELNVLNRKFNFSYKWRVEEKNRRRAERNANQRVLA